MKNIRENVQIVIYVFIFFSILFCRPLSQQRTIDHSVTKVRTFLHSAKRKFKKLFMHYAHYGPEIGFCTCLAKHAWFKYPAMSQITYATLGHARRSISSFMQDVMEGFVQTYFSHGHEYISNKVSQTTSDDYFDYQNGIAEDYGPSRRIGQFSEDFTQNTPNVQVIEKADPKLISIVEMLKNLKPKVNQNDSFIIRYARALNSYSQKIHSDDDGDEKKRTVRKDKMRKYSKKYQHDMTRKMTETSVGNVNSSSINGTTNEGRSMGYQYSNNRRVLVPGVPAGLPSFDELPSADCKTLFYIHSLTYDLYLCIMIMG